MLKLTYSTTHTHSQATPVTGGTMACLGAGTGLGQVFATKSKDSKYYTVHPTEGTGARINTSVRI